MIKKFEKKCINLFIQRKKYIHKTTNLYVQNEDLNLQQATNIEIYDIEYIFTLRDQQTKSENVATSTHPLGNRCYESLHKNSTFCTPFLTQLPSNRKIMIDY